MSAVRIYGFDEQGGLIETFVLPTGSGTQELAFVEPQGLVTLGRAPELVPWLIGLGRLAAVAHARTARAGGVTIFTIRLGSDADAITLTAIADTPEQYFYSPDAADLAEVYGRIARLVPCLPGRFWGGR